MKSKVTLKEVAEALGVSAMTVSRAINERTNVDEKTRERILKKAEEMGYTPNLVAKSLVSQKTFTIGVVIPEISHTFFAQVISGIENVTFKKNYQLILTNSAENFQRERKALETLISQRVDGILISCTMNKQDFSYHKQLIEKDVPLVFFDRCIQGLSVSTVSVDDRVGSKNVTQHLIDHGYKKIAYFRGPEISIGKERFLGYLDALSENNIPVREEWIIESGFQEKGGYEAMERILQLPEKDRPRAIVTVNDPAAIGAMEAIYEHGFKVPADFAIVGFSDDIRAKFMKSPLTTIRQRPFDIGHIAAEKLIRTIENEDEPVENRVIVTELVIRESCGCENYKKYFSFKQNN